MAKIWNLVDTLITVPPVKRRGTSDGANYLYFVIGGLAAHDNVVYRWSPALVFTDISGATFGDPGDGTYYVVEELCWFDGDLYARVRHCDGVGNYSCEIYTWTGGTNWSLIDTFGPYDVATSMGDLECDASKIVCINNDAGKVHLHMSTDGAIWNECTADGGDFDETAQHLIGLTRNTAYGLAIGVVYQDAMDDCWAFDAGVDWQKVNLGASTVLAGLTGYLNSESQFASYNVGGEKMQYSTDWGVTFSTANGYEDFIGYLTYAQNFAGTYEAFVEGGNTIYTYDSVTDTWSEDGTMAGVSIRLLFQIGSTFYVITEGGEVYESVTGYHVATSIDAGANWSSIIGNWDANYCSSLLALPKVGADRQLVAVRAAATAKIYAGVNSLSYKGDFAGATATPTDGIAQGNDNKTYIAAANDALIVRSADFFATQSDYKTGLTAAVGLTSIKKV